jgi:hypothetical protein
VSEIGSRCAGLSLLGDIATGDGRRKRPELGIALIDLSKS